MISIDKELNKYICEKDFQSIVKRIIKKSSCILDIGCGIGDYLKFTSYKQRVVAIDPHLPYLEKAKERVPWAEFVHKDGLSYLNSTQEKFDCILMIDVLEHLEENDAIKLVTEAKKHCNEIIFSQIPIGIHKQEEDIWNLGGEYWQTHRSIWDEKNVEKLGFNFIQIWNDWYDWEHKDRRTSIALWSKYPIVSIIVPTYNQAEWLPKTLDSIINQTYPFWETIVVNDGSTDNTEEVIAEYEKKDNRIRGFHKPNGGISSALNTGIEKSRGEFFCWLSSDDLFYPEKLELQIETFNKLDQNYGIVFGQFDLIDANENLTILEQSKPFIDGLEFPQQLKYDMIDGCTVMIPMQIMKELNGFNLQFKHAQDTEFWFRLAAKGYKFYYIDKKLVKRRIHESQGFSDFQLDCRYDGYAIVNFYLSRYSFRDFYKNIDWDKEEDLRKFISHFFDMIAEEGCHINHPVLKEKFWNWFLDGIKTLDKETRIIILKNGLEFFSGKKSQGEFYKEYLQKFKSALKTIVNNQKKSFVANHNFEDITLLNRFDERDYSNKLYSFGEKCEKKGDILTAVSVFKYLADYKNLYTEKAFKKFAEWCFINEEYQKFVKSFRRKGDPRLLDDDAKLLLLWAKLSIGSNDQIDDILDSFLDPLKKTYPQKWKSGSFEETNINNIQFWNYTVIPYKVDHYLKIKCSHCNNILNLKLSFPIAKEKSIKTYLCTNCFTGYQISDSMLKEYFENKFVKKDTEKLRLNHSPHVAFVLRYTNIIGGGLKVVYRHIQWLNYLGCKITTYSDAPKPDWIELPGKFIRVKDHYEINNLKSDVVIVFSIYDVPKILTKVNAKIVYHICQGYEGYHLGRNYEELRSDKYFYTVLHSFNVGRIVVSKHLREMFKAKFNSYSHYIPNSIDLKTFFPNPIVNKEPNSILFIGNPNDPLKGIQFLIDSLLKLQTSERRFKVINLFIVWGSTRLNDDTTEKEIAGIKIHYLKGLKSENVAELMNKVSLVVNCSWYEGFTLPILEAMACGTPTITTSNMGAESFCIDGENSFVIDYGNHNALIERIRDILLSRIDLEPVVRNGFNTAFEYSVENTFMKFVEEYSKILSYEFDKNKVTSLLNKFTVNKPYLLELLNVKIKNTYYKQKPMVSIIIVTYNQIEYTLACIKSIKRYTNCNYEIIVVDNASSDNTCEALQGVDNIQLIPNEENVGFPNAVNQGILASEGEYVLLLNNDTIVTNKWLERLLEIAVSNDNVGIVAPISNEVSGLQKDNEANYKTIEEMFLYAEEVKQKNRGNLLHFPRVAFLCTLIKKEVIDKIGGLDERFSPGNYEDDDFCLRAQLAGYKTVIAKDVFIHHFGSKSFKANGITNYGNRLEINRKKFVDKWGATPEEIWLENKPIQKRNVLFPINKNLFKQYFDRAKIFVAENELELAKESIIKSVEYFKESDKLIITYDELLDLAGNICLAANDFEKAQKYFEMELEIFPSSSNACLGLGQIFYLNENFEAAKTMLEWAVKNDANNVKAVEALNNVNQLLGLEINHNSLMEN